MMQILLTLSRMLPIPLKLMKLKLLPQWLGTKLPVD
jgi:hypothetical protein